MARLSERNYIPKAARAEYEKAFVREFRKFLGQPYVEPPREELEIKVLGQGCVQCDKLEQLIMEILTEIQVPANVDHVRDINEIAQYGPIGVPALLINGQVKSTGVVPNRNKIKNWLVEAASAMASSRS
jgi:hypothetical protein